MADLKIRRLERAAGAGDPSAQGQLLLERVRAGELPRERVQIAAALGHAASCVALGRAPLPEIPELDDWLHELDHYGREPLIRAAVAAGQCVWPCLAGGVDELVQPFLDALEAAEAWLAQPREATRIQARLLGGEAQEKARRLAGEPQESTGLDDDAVFAAEVLARVAQAAGSLKWEDLEQRAHEAIHWAIAHDDETPEPIAEEIRQRVLGWALSHVVPQPTNQAE